MFLKILSLDLDWFNPVETSELPAYIRYFFARLRATCTLPKDIALLTEHHYLYPWCARLLERHNVRQVEVVNVDAHHDFYRLHEIKDFTASKVHAGNFFAFMAHAGMLTRYTWVTNKGALASALSKRPELLDSLERSTSPRVRGMRRRVAVRRMLDVWRVLHGQTFHGFAIVASPCYTRTDLIGHSVNHILKKEFSGRGYTVRRNPCSAEFTYTGTLLATLARLNGRGRRVCNEIGPVWAPAQVEGARSSVSPLPPHAQRPARY